MSTPHKVGVFLLLFFGFIFVVVFVHQHKADTTDKADAFASQNALSDAQRLICPDGDVFVSHALFPEQTQLHQCDNFFAITNGEFDTWTTRFYNQNGKEIGYVTGGLGLPTCMLRGKKCNHAKVTATCSNKVDVCADIPLECGALAEVKDEDLCYYVNALRMNEVGECKKIQNAHSRGVCFLDVATQSNDVRVCEEIQDEWTQTLCKERVNEAPD